MPPRHDSPGDNELAAEIVMLAKRQVYQNVGCGVFLYYHPYPADYWLFGPEVGVSRGKLRRRTIQNQDAVN